MSSDVLDQEIFQEFLLLDDDDPTREFTKSIISKFYEQADQTFIEMEKLIVHCDYMKISELGHFLKGSSAQIGISKLRDTCEKIQNVGRLLKEDGTGRMSTHDAITRLEDLVPLAKQQYDEAEVVLRQTFG